MQLDTEKKCPKEGKNLSTKKYIHCTKNRKELSTTQVHVHSFKNIRHLHNFSSSFLLTNFFIFPWLENFEQGPFTQKSSTNVNASVSHFLKLKYFKKIVATINFILFSRANGPFNDFSSNSGKRYTKFFLKWLWFFGFLRWKENVARFTSQVEQKYMDHSFFLSM